MEPIRLVTIHPALVHVTLGAIPILVLAYIVGWRRRSERWTFVGDVTLGVVAAATVIAAVFGLVAFVRVDWPGGIGFWRWLHLGLGVTATLLLVAFAGVRFAKHRARPVGGGGSAWASILIGGLVLGTGWVGGEVLVFHAGIAVKAAGEGALAPPIQPDRGAARDLETAMHRIREAWARITTSVATMIVEEPRQQLFRQIARDAGELKRHAAQVAGQGETTDSHAHAVDSGRARYARLGSPPSSTETDHDHATQRDDHGLASMAGELERHAARMEALALEQRLPDLATQLGETTALCAHCHQEMRWNHEDAR